MNSSILNTFRLYSLVGEPVLVQPFGAIVPPGYETLPQSFALACLEDWLLSERDRWVLIDLYTSMFGVLTIGASNCHDLRAKIGPSLRLAVERQDLVFLVETRSYISVSVEPVPANSDPSLPVETESSVEFSYYEIIVLDELEKPIVGVELRLSTPLGSTLVTTDASGRVRVDRAPPGFGRAEIVSPRKLAEAMSGHEQRPLRTTSLPKNESWHLQTPSLLSAVVLPDASPQKLSHMTCTG